MSDIAIKVEHLSKQYRIGERESYKALRDVIADAAAAPFRRVKSAFNGNGSANGSASSLVTQESSGEIRNSKSEIRNSIWALDDVSFEVKQGEVVGIIGRNGAGKSTLLKILSRITKPTKGHAKIFGRVGSLLEVGTGFHPELTGRENIFLNGAILGMRKAEIERKFDEIVAFAEVEKFIDTPVKRYSSGMYVRLAFAVAAHMETEVLIVDEVLAVGDAEFQKKCLGKMGDVANTGRTVLFVSHNMQAISQLTRRCLLLENGEVGYVGATSEAVSKYAAAGVNQQGTSSFYSNKPSDLANYVEMAQVCTSESDGIHKWGHPIQFKFQLRVNQPIPTLCFSFQVMNDLQQPVCHFWLFDSDVPYRTKRGLFELTCDIPRFRLFMGKYTLTTWLSERRSTLSLENLTSICPFEVSLDHVGRPEYTWEPKACAYLEDAVWHPVQQTG